MNHSSTKRSKTLTDREKEIVALLRGRAKPGTTGIIAGLLKVSVSTARRYLSKLVKRRILETKDVYSVVYEKGQRKEKGYLLVRKRKRKVRKRKVRPKQRQTAPTFRRRRVKGKIQESMVRKRRALAPSKAQVSIKRDRENTIREGENNMPIDVMVVLAAGSAALQAIQTWISARDRKSTLDAYEQTYKKVIADPATESTARFIVTMIPSEILDTFGRRTDKCWNKYHEMLKSDDEYMPDELDSATIALKKCICRELRRIKELNGVIPPGPMTLWWEEYQCGKQKTTRGQ